MKQQTFITRNRQLNDLFRMENDFGENLSVKLLYKGLSLKSYEQGKTFYGLDYKIEEL